MTGSHGQFADPQYRTDRFHYDGRSARFAVPLLAALLALIVAAALLGPGFEPDSADAVWAVLAAGFLLVLIGGFAWAARRRPALLTVGPEGLHMPLAFRGPVPWDDVRRIRLVSPTRSLSGRAQWLRVELVPGRLPDYRLPTLRRFELWYQRHAGLRVALHALDAEPETVVGSIERFHPVVPM